MEVEIILLHCIFRPSQQPRTNFAKRKTFRFFYNSKVGMWITNWSIYRHRLWWCMQQFFTAEKD